jgi:hypothetical protein
MRRICSGLIPLHAASIESGSFLHRRLLHFERKKRLIPKDLLLFSMPEGAWCHNREKNSGSGSVCSAFSDCYQPLFSAVDGGPTHGLWRMVDFPYSNTCGSVSFEDYS